MKTYDLDSKQAIAKIPEPTDKAEELRTWIKNKGFNPDVTVRGQDGKVYFIVDDKGFSEKDKADMDAFIQTL